MSAIVIEGSLVHYETIGRGQPTVFLHGWLGSWRYWMHSMEELAPSSRSYALDLWGFGDTDRAAGRHTVDDYVMQLEAFLDTLGLWRVTLIGHALGAAVVIKFAGLFPVRVERLMAISLPLSKSMVNRRALTGGGALGLFGYRWQEHQEVAIESHKTHPDAINTSLDSLDALDVEHELAMLNMPLLLVHGAKDPIVKPFGEEILNPALPNTRLIPFENSRHFPMLEERNKFNRLLKDFFATGDNLRALELKEEWRRRSR
jgi:pimeloyl-ACP methyl ester carboxylesterase